MTREDVDKVGRGRVWTGRQARELKLVDELGGLYESDRAGQGPGRNLGRDEEPRLVVWPKKKGFWSSIVGRRADGSSSGLRPDIDTALRTLRLLEKTRVWAICPLGMGVPGFDIPGGRKD